VSGLVESDSARSRLLVAVVLSAALHLSFIYGVAPRPGTRAHPIAPLAARLVPEAIPSPVPVAKRVAPSVPRASAQVHPQVNVPALPPEIPSVAVPAANGAQLTERREDSALPKADLPFPVDLQWYEARDLDTYPRARSSIEIPYPASARADGVHGAVMLLLAIDESGAVRDASVVSAEPPGYFEASALDAAHAAQFAPGEKDGHPVRSKIIIKLRIAPEQQR
jgi:periplasmic protein TonB